MHVLDGDFCATYAPDLGTNTLGPFISARVAPVGANPALAMDSALAVVVRGSTPARSREAHVLHVRPCAGARAAVPARGTAAQHGTYVPPLRSAALGHSRQAASPQHAERRPRRPQFDHILD